MVIPDIECNSQQMPRQVEQRIQERLDFRQSQPSGVRKTNAGWISGKINTPIDALRASPFGKEQLVISKPTGHCEAPQWEQK